MIKAVNGARKAPHEQRGLKTQELEKLYSYKQYPTSIWVSIVLLQLTFKSQRLCSLTPSLVFPFLEILFSMYVVSTFTSQIVSPDISLAATGPLISNILAWREQFHIPKPCTCQSVDDLNCYTNISICTSNLKRKKNFIILLICLHISHLKT